MHAVTVTVALDDIEPRIWRTLEVPAEYDLGEVHRTLNVAMGWLDCHLHEFDIEGRRYGVPDTDWSVEGESIIAESTVGLGELAAAGVERFTYAYDFGDDWRHTVSIDGVAPAEEGVFYPRCIAGERAAVPEDCGGLPGFEMFLEAMANPEHPEHAEMVEWYGTVYDPDGFDITELNRVMRALSTGVLPEGYE